MILIKKIIFLGFWNSLILSSISFLIFCFFTSGTMQNEMDQNFDVVSVSTESNLSSNESNSSNPTGGNSVVSVVNTIESNRNSLFRLIYFANFIDSTINTMMVGLQSEILEKLGRPRDDAYAGGVISSFFTAGAFIFSPIFGYLFDKMQNKIYPLQLGMLSMLISSVFTVFTSSLPLLVISRFCEGVATASITNAGNSILSQYTTIDNRDSALKMVSTADRIGNIVGLLVGPISKLNNSIPLEGPFLLASIAVLICVMWSYSFSLDDIGNVTHPSELELQEKPTLVETHPPFNQSVKKEESPYLIKLKSYLKSITPSVFTEAVDSILNFTDVLLNPDPSTPLGNVVETTKLYFSKRKSILFGVTEFCLSMISSFISGHLITHVKEHLKYSDIWILVFYLFFLVAQMAGTWSTGYLSNYLTNRSMIQMSFVLIAHSIPLIGSARKSLWQLIPRFLFVGFSFGFLAPFSLEVLNSTKDVEFSHLSTTLQSLFNNINQLGQIIGPILTGYLTSRYSYKGAVKYVPFLCYPLVFGFQYFS